MREEGAVSLDGQRSVQAHDVNLAFAAYHGVVDHEGEAFRRVIVQIRIPEGEGADGEGKRIAVGVHGPVDVHVVAFRRMGERREVHFQRLAACAAKLVRDHDVEAVHIADALVVQPVIEDIDVGGSAGLHGDDAACRTGRQCSPRRRRAGATPPMLTEAMASPSISFQASWPSSRTRPPLVLVDIAADGGGQIAGEYGRGVGVVEVDGDGSGIRAPEAVLHGVGEDILPGLACGVRIQQIAVGSVLMQVEGAVVAAHHQGSAFPHRPRPMFRAGCR